MDQEVERGQSVQQAQALEEANLLYGRVLGIVEPIRLRYLSELGFTLAQLRVLGTPAERPGLSLRDVASALKVTPSTVNPPFDRLVRHGFVATLLASIARGVASGMRSTFQNSGMVPSIGLFFSLMIAGLSHTLPQTLYAGLAQNGVPSATARQIANLPPVSSLFAAILSYNPIQQLLGPLLGHLPAAGTAYLTGKTFFPQLISQPFITGLRITFVASLIMCLLAAAASWLRGGRNTHDLE